MAPCHLWKRAPNSSAEDLRCPGKVPPVRLPEMLALKRTPPCSSELCHPESAPRFWGSVSAVLPAQRGRCQQQAAFLQPVMQGPRLLQLWCFHPWSLRVPQTERKNAEKSPLNRLGLQVTHVASNPICWCLVQTVVPRRAELAPLYACGLQGVRTFWRKNCLGPLLESGYRHSEYLELYAPTSVVAY